MSKLVYVATPYSGLQVNEKHRRAVGIAIARDECRKVKTAGFVPVSTILLWDTIYSETRDREKIMYACKEIIKMCDYIYVSKHPDAKFSKGITQERVWAEEFGLSFISFDESGECE